MIGGEVDAVDPQTRAPIEVKTSMQIRSLRDEERFEKKMLRFYMQSFLLGVQKVVVGFRNARGILVTHQSFATLNMPRAVRGKVSALSVAESLLIEVASRVGSECLSKSCRRASVGHPKVYLAEYALPAQPTS